MMRTQELEDIAKPLGTIFPSLFQPSHLYVIPMDRYLSSHPQTFCRRSAM